MTATQSGQNQRDKGNCQADKKNGSVIECQNQVLGENLGADRSSLWLALQQRPRAGKGRGSGAEDSVEREPRYQLA